MYHTNRRVRQREKQKEKLAEAGRHEELKRQRDESMRCYGDDPERLPEAEGDSGGERRFLRSTQRKAAEAVSLGIMTKEQTETLLKGSFGLVADSINRKSARDCRSAWYPILAAANLELQYNQLSTRMFPVRDLVAAASEDGEQEEMQQIAFIQQASLEADAAAMSILDQFGLLRSTTTITTDAHDNT